MPKFPADGTTTVDPNKPYSQFANLVKQSYTGVPTYSGVSGVQHERHDVVWPGQRSLVP